MGRKRTINPNGYPHEGEALHEAYNAFKNDHKGYTQEDVAKVLNKSLKYVNLALNGKVLLKDYDYEKLSEAWGFNISFLKGKSKHKTDEEKLAFDLELDKIKYIKVTDFLLLAGLHVKPYVVLNIYTDDLLPIWHKIKKYIEDKDVPTIEMELSLMQKHKEEGFGEYVHLKFKDDAIPLDAYKIYTYKPSDDGGQLFEFLEGGFMKYADKNPDNEAISILMDLMKKNEENVLHSPSIVCFYKVYEENDSLNYFEMDCSASEFHAYMDSLIESAIYTTKICSNMQLPFKHLI